MVLIRFSAFRSPGSRIDHSRCATQRGGRGREQLWSTIVLVLHKEMKYTRFHYLRCSYCLCCFLDRLWMLMLVAFAANICGTSRTLENTIFNSNFTGKLLQKPNTTDKTISISTSHNVWQWLCRRIFGQSSFLIFYGCSLLAFRRWM